MTEPKAVVTVDASVKVEFGADYRLRSCPNGMEIMGLSGRAAVIPNERVDELVAACHQYQMGIAAAKVATAAVQQAVKDHKAAPDKDPA